MQEIRGMEAMLHKMELMKTHTGRVAARKSILASLAVMKDAIRAGINNSSAPPAVKAEARKTIGKRLAKAREAAGRIGGKAGFAVAQNVKKLKRAAGKHYASGRPGVGLSAADVHWFVLGTAQRQFKKPHTALFAGERDFRFVRRSGKIKPWLQGITESAVAGAIPAVLEAYRQKLTEVIAADAAKK